jgi:hypothetical protein
MTGFGSLYYTDCRPGEGLQGGAGFQFQAATPGPAAEAMGLVQRTLLYEPPAGWMRERRPVGDYPRSLAHTAQDGFFGTAGGCYLGQEANGTREGNQFTHAAVTRDEDAYGVLRPAQLWAAPWWAGAPAAGTELAELPANPEPGPLDVETVRDRIAAADGEDRLVALLSAVHGLADPQTRRTVVLVSADPELAACWIAAATLLLPRPRALRTGFKIYVADPQFGRHDIVVLHPDWAGPWADTGAASGLVVFDLDRDRQSVVEPTPAAAFWAPLFLREDPYDVVDAVELAAQFAAEREPDAADRAVAVLVSGGRLAGPGAVARAARWLGTASDEAVRIARDTVLEAVLDAVADHPDLAAPAIDPAADPVADPAADPAADPILGAPPVAGSAAPVLRSLAEAAERRGWEADALDRVRSGLLTAELAEVRSAADGIAALGAAAGRPRLPDQDPAPARAEVETALATAPPDRVAALLAVADRHRVEPATSAYRDALHGFARWWVTRPEPELEPAGWTPPEALDALRDVLRAELSAPGVADAVRSRWWRHLWSDATDPTEPLDALLLSAAYAGLAEPERTELIRKVLDRCAPAPLAVPATTAWTILFGSAVPPLPAAYEFLRGVYDLRLGIDAELADRLVAVARREPAITVQRLWMVSMIRAYGHPLPSPLDRLAAHDDAARAVAAELAADRPVRSDADLVRDLDGVDPRLLRLRAGELVDAVLAARLPGRAVTVLLGCGRETLSIVFVGLQQRWPAPGRCAGPHRRAAAFTFLLTTDTSGERERVDDLKTLRHRLAGRVGELSDEERAAIGASYPGGLGEVWRQWARGTEPNAVKRGLGRMRPDRSARREG